MTELLKREVSLTVLKVRLLDDYATSAPGSGATATANQALTTHQRIFCELQVTGNAEERGLVAPAAPASNRPPARRNKSSKTPAYDSIVPPDPALLSRTLAQWSYAPEEMQVPIHHRAATNFQDRPSAPRAWLADVARAAVTKIFSEMRADGLERFAAAASWLPSGKPTLPSTMVRQLHALLTSVMRDDDSLWLELADPVGYLPLLPWEEMLRPVTPAPILRLSPHPVKALSCDRELSVVLCLTVPSEKWTLSVDQLAAMMQAMRESLPNASTVHVFPDDLYEAVVGAAIERIGTHDSSERCFKAYALPCADWLTKAGGEPWRAWIGHSLAQRAADVVHCVAPGMLFPDHARLVIARDPLSTSCPDAPGGRARPLRYVTPLELSESLVLLGAWAMVFSCPPRGPWVSQSRLGLRLFADRIARCRAGVAAFHDLDADTGFAALRETYSFIIGDPSIKASKNPAVSVYCHPGRAMAMPSPVPSALPPELVAQYMSIKNAIEARYAGRPLPAWVAATQRMAEQAVSRIANAEEKGSDEAVARGVAAALAYVQKIIAQPASASVEPQSLSSSVQKGGSASA